MWVWVGVVASPLAGMWAEKIRSDRMPVTTCYFIGLVSTGLVISGYVTHALLIQSLLSSSE